MNSETEFLFSIGIKTVFCEKKVFLEIAEKRAISALLISGLILARPPQRMDGRPIYMIWRHVSLRPLALGTFDLGLFSKGSGRPKEHPIFEAKKILYTRPKFIITKDRVNGICWITCKYMQVPEKVCKYYTVTWHGSQIQAFVRSKNLSARSGQIWYAIQYVSHSFLKNKFLSFEEWVSCSKMTCKLAVIFLVKDQQYLWPYVP